MKTTRFARPITLILLAALLWGQISPTLGLAAIQPGQTDSPATASSQPAEEPPAGGPEPAPWLPFDEAFTQRVTKPDGGQVLLISATPLHYRGAQGDWQPIDPSFRPVEGGFANDTNLLQIRARADSVVVAARYEADQLAWQPDALHLISGGTATLLAEATAGARAAASENTVRYAGGWTLDGISDEVVAGPGQLEHNVLFQGRPPIEGDAGSALALSALLRLPTGLRLYAEGALREGGFETAGEVELRDAAGRTRLALATARVYEQRRPEQAIVAGYRFEPQDAVTWRVTMTTPAAWWLAADRTFPVVWDPAFAVVGSVQMTEIQGPGLGLSWLCYQYDAARVGGVGTNSVCGERRLLVKFNGLSPNLFPPGFAIERAQLVMAPSGGWQRYASNGAPLPIDTVVDVYAATNGNTAWPGPAKGAHLCASERLLLRNAPNVTPVEFCDIQSGNSGVVNTWINGGANNGLLLQQSPNEVCGWAGCGFVTLPKRGSWKAVNPGGGLIYDPALKGTGVALVIHYQGPVLAVSQPFRYDSPPALPVQDGSPFARTDHSYRLPNTGGKWTAVGVKAMRKTVNLDANQTLQGSFGYSQWSQLVGNVTAPGNLPVRDEFAFPFPLSLVTPNCLGNTCQTQSLGSGNTDSSNFVLLKGSGAGKEVRIGPVDPNPNLDHYIVEVAPSVDIPTPANYATAAYDTGVRFGYDFELDTSHILAALNLPLLKDTQARVTLTWEIQGMNNPTASVQGRLFPPAATGSAYAKKTQLQVKLGEPAEIPWVTQGGDYGLVLELPGDNTAVDALLRDPGAWGDLGEPAQRVIRGRVDVQVCPMGDEISDTGCAKGFTPDWSKLMNIITVGDYWIYSPASYVCNPDKFYPNPVYPSCRDQTGGIKQDKTCPNEWCALRYGPDGQEYFATLTWGTTTRRVVAVVGSDAPQSQKYLLSATTSGGQRILRSYGKVVLRAGGPAPGGPLASSPRQLLWTRNSMTNDGGAQLLKASCYENECPGLPLSDYDRYNSRSSGNVQVVVNVRQNNADTERQYARYTTEVARPLQTEAGTEYQSFALTWDVRAEGYRGRLESPAGDGPLNVGVARAGTNVSAVRIAGLKYYFNNKWDADFNPDPTVGYFDRFRSDDGSIRQDPKLGGAWGYVDYLILPYGQGASLGAALNVCKGFCGDVRARNDTWAAPNRNWKMPDVNINQLPPQTVAFSQADGTVVFSDDRSAATATPAATDIGFSFKTFGAKVTIEERACPGSDNAGPVQVIHGETSLSLPGVGGDSGGVQAEFDLCETQLKRVKLTYIPVFPGIPIAYPPVMYVDMVSGTVDINPDFARIAVDVGFYAGVGWPKLIKGVGTVTLDTRGLFDMQMNARVMGIADSQGHLWVAWNPLDAGFGIDNTVPNRDDWILRGFMYAHMWIGQGWQHKYKWLPDDQKFHFTASYQTQARIPIKTGALINEFPLVVPPFGVTLTDQLELSFGQFCANDGCSQTKVGMKGKRKLFGYDAGLYVDLDCTSANPAVAAGAVIFPPVILACSSFILGSDAHVLIDQYGGGGPPFPLAAEAASGERITRLGNQAVVENLQQRTVADPTAADAEEALPAVTAQTGGFMLAFAWARGAPTISLIRPDGVEISPDNATAYGIEVTTSPNQIIFGADSSTGALMEGVWRARIGNATAEDDYRLAYFANKTTPPLVFTAPVGNIALNANTHQTYRIAWNPPANAANLRLSLYYIGANAGALSETQQVGGMIVQNLNPADGFFDWDITGLRTGEYQIYGRLEDKAGANVSPTATNQFVGVTESLTPGRISYTDAKAPAPLNAAQVMYTPVDGGVRMCWPVSPATDLAEYRLDYVVSDPIGARDLAERVPADVRYEPDGSALQCVRLVGLINGRSLVEFDRDPAHGLSVGDASGNYSAPVKPVNFTVPAGGTDLAPAGFVITGTVNTGDASVMLTWPVDTGARWELFYGKETPASPLIPQAGAVEGASPIALGASFSGSTTLRGLPRGYWYSFAARAFGSADPYASAGPLSNHVWLLVSNGVDADADGCADDWQTAHGVTNTAADPDSDTLATRDECRRGTRPDRFDTDGDGWSDGEEVAYSTDPLDPLSYPQITPDASTAPLPRLALDETTLTFHAFTQGPNPDAQTVALQNLGGGALSPSASADRPWLLPAIVNGSLVVNINKAGLGWGRYSSRVTVSGGAGVMDSPQTVTVNLAMLAGAPPDGGARRALFLPLIKRDIAGAAPAATPTQPAATITATPTRTPTPTVSAAADLVVYDDALAAGWENWSWDAIVNFASTTHVKTGSASIAVSHMAAWGGLSLRAPAAVNTASYSAIRFWVYGHGQSLALYTQPGDSEAASPFFTFTPPADQWTQVTAPLSALGNPAQIKRINLQENTGAAGPVFYLDDVRLVAAGQ